MKSMMKILLRYVLSAAGVALILLAINFIVAVIWIIQASKMSVKEYNVSQVAEGLTITDGAYSLSRYSQEIIDRHFEWALLMDKEGNVVWSEYLPDDIPTRFSIPDVASFTRWYLNDYPVYVWRHLDGLFVLGSPKGTKWKSGLEMPQSVLENIILWVPVVVAINCVVAVFLALIFGLRLYHSLKPIAKGIKDMAENRPVDLSTKGLLGDLAAGINMTSTQLEKQKTKLNTRDTARTTWIAGISHDIRTPLAIVMGYASQLEEDQELSPNNREQAAAIRCQSQRIKALVNNLNLASKLEYEMQPLQKTEIHIAALFREIVADFLNRGLSPAYSLSLCISETAQNTLISGDKELLTRALCNLIENSINHNQNGCSIQIVLETNTASCSLTISDDGTGFSQSAIDNLNLSETTEKLESHGLGLTIVQQIIKAHDGTLRFFNLPDCGCSVAICLPLAPEKQ